MSGTNGSPPNVYATFTCCVVAQLLVMVTMTPPSRVHSPFTQLGTAVAPRSWAGSWAWATPCAAASSPRAATPQAIA
ncbi:hypothetical protein AB0B51_20855 [Streptomyces griseus]